MVGLGLSLRCEVLSGDGCAGGDFFAGREDDDVLEFFAIEHAGGEEHAVGFFAAEFAGCEIDDDDDLFADECFGFVAATDTGADLTVPKLAEVDLDFEETVGIGMRFTFDDGGDAEVDFGEVIVDDFRFGEWFFFGLWRFGFGICFGVGSGVGVCSGIIFVGHGISNRWIVVISGRLCVWVWVFKRDCETYAWG